MIILRNRFFSDEEDEKKEDRYHTGRNIAIASGIGALGTGIGAHHFHKDAEKYLKDSDEKTKAVDELAMREAEAKGKWINLASEKSKLVAQNNAEKGKDDRRNSLIDNAKKKIESIKNQISVCEYNIGAKDAFVTSITGAGGTVPPGVEKRQKELIEEKKKLETKLSQFERGLKELETMPKGDFSKIKEELNNIEPKVRSSKSEYNNLSKELRSATSIRDSLLESAEKAKLNRGKALKWGIGLTGAAALGTGLYNLHKNAENKKK